MRWALCLVAAALACACKPETRQPPSSGSATARPVPATPADALGPVIDAASARTWYRVVVREPPYEVPFFLALPDSEADEHVIIANGSERLEIDAKRRADHVRVDFGVAGTALELDLHGERVEGTWLADHTLRGNFPVSGTRVAEPDPQLRYPAAAPAAVDVSGVWDLDIEKSGPAKARLEQRADGILEGTINDREIGDWRFLAGRVTGHKLALSTFDGLRAFSIEATVDKDGRTLTHGIAHYPGWSHAAFHGKKAAGGELGTEQTGRMKPARTHVTLRELDDPGLRGKAVIVDLFGTWCAACWDMTPFLVDRYNRHRAAGLEVIAVAIEPFDEAYSLERIAALRSRYKVTFPISLRVMKTDSVVDQLPPELDQVSGLPVTLFIDRRGTVRAVHTGFIGPASKVDHARQTEMFDRLIDEILRSD